MYKLIRYFEYFQRKAVKKFSTAFYLGHIRDYMYISHQYKIRMWICDTQLWLYRKEIKSRQLRSLFIVAIIRKATDYWWEIFFAIQLHHHVISVIEFYSICNRIGFKLMICCDNSVILSRFIKFQSKSTIATHRINTYHIVQ